ncbi:MAG TPA: hypothetical protein VMV08_10675 [Gaiellaceae bacterium]|nr:hypothetical protein [Gaiellaceae bacterium]
MLDDLDFTVAAAHEAGHVVVAHALGRDVLQVSFGRAELPHDHPGLPPELQALSNGRTLVGPLWEERLSEQFRDCEPFGDIQIAWLRAEMVMCYAGWIAEQALVGSYRPVGAYADWLKAVTAANLLGLAEMADGHWRISDTISAELERIGRLIIEDLRPGLVRLAETFATIAPAEIDEPAIRAMLADLGLARASHVHLLEPLG